MSSPEDSSGMKDPPSPSPGKLAGNEDPMAVEMGVKSANWKAIENEIPADNRDTDVLRTVLQENFKLAQVETPIDRFLAISNGDSRRATSALARYWKLRKEHFDKDHFARPLTMTGKGALSSADEEVFKSGFLVALPPDHEGRPIVCFDSSRLERDFSSDFLSLLPSTIRCAHYVLSVAASVTKAFEKGLVVLLVSQSTSRLLPFETRFHSEFFELISSFPFKSRLTKLVFVVPRENWKTPEQKAIQQQILKSEHDCKEVCVIKGQVSKEVGLPFMSTPASIGGKTFVVHDTLLPFALILFVQTGKWGYYTHFNAWRRERVVQEELMDTKVSENYSEEMVREILAREEAKKRKREQDVDYARRKRRNATRLKQDLTVQVEELKHKNRSLREEGDRLYRLFCEARRQLDFPYHRKRNPMMMLQSPGSPQLEVPAVEPAQFSFQNKRSSYPPHIPQAMSTLHHTDPPMTNFRSSLEPRNEWRGPQQVGQPMRTMTQSRALRQLDEEIVDLLHLKRRISSMGGRMY